MRFAMVAQIGLAVVLGAAAPTQISAREIVTPSGHHTQYSITILNDLNSGSQTVTNSINIRAW